MQIRVEFFGIARQRAAVSQIAVEVPDQAACLADVLRALGASLPEFGRACLIGGRLHPSLAINLDGQQFIADPTTPVRQGQCILVLSADAGG